MSVKERWAEPPTVYAVEERGQTLALGRVQWDIPVFVLDQDGIDRIRLGYVCIACLQCHERPYPEFCALESCRFPIRALQDQAFEHLYLGEMDVGPSTTLADEWEMAKEEVERQRRGEPSLWTPTSIQEH